MLFIVTATIARLDRGFESDHATTRPVIHAVEAKDAEEATSILQQHYERRNEPDSPYSTRYSVSDANAFEPLSMASLALPWPAY